MRAKRRQRLAHVLRSHFAREQHLLRSRTRTQQYVVQSRGCDTRHGSYAPGFARSGASGAWRPSRGAPSDGLGATDRRSRSSTLHTPPRHPQPPPGWCSTHDLWLKRVESLGWRH
jgi:hypothetical protein